jgi:hypothetical protein
MKHLLKSFAGAKQLLSGGARAAAALIPDLLALSGAASISYGAALIYIPAGYITGGALLLVLGLLAARKASAS